MSRRTATARASATGEPLRSAPSTAKSPSNPAPNKSSNRLDGDFFRSLLKAVPQRISSSGKRQVYRRALIRQSGHIRRIEKRWIIANPPQPPVSRPAQLGS